MSSLITTFVFLSLILPLANSQPNALFTPVKKDDTTNLYTMLIYMKTPLQPSQLHLDLGSYLPWYDCNHNYISSSYQPVSYDSPLCEELDTRLFGSCFDKPGPGCSNLTCFFHLANPVTHTEGRGNMITDFFDFPNPVKPGPAETRFVFSCSNKMWYSRLYGGLAKGSTGLASLGRFNYSLSAQISRVHAAPWIFAVCLPSSSKSSGIVVFNSAGPYYFSPKIDVSKVLTYTPLIQGRKGVVSDTLWWYKSPDYYVGLSSLRVGSRVVGLNRTLLEIDENGVGGTLISTSSPYTVLESSIYKAVVDAFVEESGVLDLTVSKPVEPFSVCFDRKMVRTTSLGPVVPTIDLGFESRRNFWRFYGSNSMARIGNKWCLAVLDGGPNLKPGLVIGGHQIQDNLLQFDLERQRVGFSSSLLLHNTACANYEFGTE